MNLDEIRDRAVINVSETAELLQLDERSVRRAIQEGELPALRLGRRVLIPVPKLLALLEDGELPSQGE